LTVRQVFEEIEPYICGYDVGAFFAIEERCPDFDEARRRGRALWDDALSSIEIEGTSDDQRKIFYTAMYHAMIDPRIIADIEGKYTGADGEIYTADGYTPRTIFSGWDVFR
jgi:putative alpha-1,2-mannosidase